MNFADRNEQEISQATRERIDEFSRELALALKRIIKKSKANEGIQTPDTLKATPISKEEQEDTQ